MLLYIVFLSGWLLVNIRKYKFNTSSLLLLLYLISAIAGSFLTYVEPSRFLFATFFSVLSHIILLFVFLYPIVYFGNHISLNAIKFNNVLIRRLSYFSILVGLSSIIVSIMEINNIINYDNLEVIRSIQLSQENMSLYEHGLLGYLATIGVVTPIFALFFSFYRLFILKKEDLYFYFLFISSFSGVSINLIIAGRDGIVRWVLFFLFNLVLFKKYISLKKISMRGWFLLIFALFCMITIFMNISTDRFGEQKKLYLSILEYIGQPFCFYSNTFNNVGNRSLFGFKSLFPILGGGVGPLEIARSSLSFRTDVFPTFVGTFVLCVGYIRTFLMGGAFFLFSLLFNKKRATKLNNLISYMIFYQIAYIGVFYFVYAMLAWQLSFFIIYILSRKVYKISNIYI